MISRNPNLSALIYQYTKFQTHQLFCSTSTAIFAGIYNVFSLFFSKECYFRRINLSSRIFYCVFRCNKSLSIMCQNVDIRLKAKKRKGRVWKLLETKSLMRSYSTYIYEAVRVGAAKRD